MSPRKEREDIRFTVGIIDHPPESGSHAPSAVRSLKMRVDMESGCGGESRYN
jgi:hypothetical protein